uniref:Mitochondrial import inner membrane translocase subunit tim29 n=1 Tax=Triatoma dimidiata TaxID=72491 RepID=A0A0V0GBN3_TRIDM
MSKFVNFSRQVRNRYGNQLYEVFGNYNKRLNSIEMPEKFKGTFIEKWVTYWKDVCRDYMDVVKDSAKEIQNSPWKGVAFFSAFTSGAYLLNTNPDENSFRNTMISYSNEMLLVGPSIRNPNCLNHLKYLEQHYNEGTIRRFSFGLFSIMWVDNYSNCLGIYKAMCPYLKPEYLTFYERILDLGCCNKWWLIEKKMKNMDVNPNEWIDKA